MASGEFGFGTPNFLESDIDTEWNAESSQFVWDSPEPDAQYPSDQTFDTTFNERQSGFERGEIGGVHQGLAESQSRPAQMSATNNRVASAGNAPKVTFTTQSSPSETSSHSSCSISSAQRKRKASSAPSQSGVSAIGSAQENNMLESYNGMDDGFSFDDPTYPAMGVGMDNLSLDALGGTTIAQEFGFGAMADSPNIMNTGLFVDKPASYSPRNFGSLGNGRTVVASPMTIQPSKTFFLSESRGQSPNSAVKMESHESSPAAFLNENSPLSGSGDGSSGVSSGISGNAVAEVYRREISSAGFGTAADSKQESNLPSIAAQPKGLPQWPCRLTVDTTPDKSRVETQIPIRLTLYDVPAGVTKMHLPAHTISKPKFQAKPPFTKSEDTLELSTMLVCASALQKDGVEERAFRRALIDEVPVKAEETQLGGVAEQDDQDDPEKPLNGGPVTICQGCIVRERKRAARKKTKKIEEEEEWAKDEAKRVIVFNCSEVRDWCVPGTKETAVKEHDMPLDVMFVNAPMRIACYCRHQSEKLGFQVIFTIKTSDGKVLAQAISNSIMITDDHKQPLSHGGAGGPMAFNGSTQMPGSVFNASGQPFGMYPTLSQDMPFRPSWSTNDLRLLGNQFSHQQQVHGFTPQRLGAIGRSQHSTASTTPRNLSRPASPTDPSGHSTKKRKSGGPVKVPAGLTMTKMPNRSPPGTGASTPIMGPSSTGPSPAAFNFVAPGQPTFGTPLEQTYSSNSMRNFSSGPSTPLLGTSMASGNIGQFGSPMIDADPYQYFSAPTSQHPSRAPSPSSTFRMPSGGFQNPHVAQQTAMALASLPAGLNLQRPPIIQRLIPNTGARSGGDEVTVLGSGFFQGLDVMFGDTLATNTTFWGDTTLVCRAPPSATTGPVSVVFKHQHSTAPPELREVQALLPTRLIAYNYYDTDTHPLHGLPIGLPNQHQGMAGTMSPDSLAQGFFNNQAAQARVPKFSRVSSSGRINQRHAEPFEAAKVDDTIRAVSRWTVAGSAPPNVLLTGSLANNDKGESDTSVCLHTDATAGFQAMPSCHPSKLRPTQDALGLNSQSENSSAPSRISLSTADIGSCFHFKRHLALRPYNLPDVVC